MIFAQAGVKYEDHRYAAGSDDWKAGMNISIEISLYRKVFYLIKCELFSCPFRPAASARN
jgi:hypothetical protein